MSFKWINEHWALISAFLAIIGTCVVAVADEYVVYSSMKEAVAEQKTFNERHDIAVKKYSMSITDLHSKQERIDERTTLMLKMLESIDQRIK